MFLKATGLGHGFDTEQRLFENLDFEIGPGELVCVSGPSGSGKSTLLSVLAGWEPPRWGSIEFFGSPRVAWVFQNPHGIAGRMALDHVALPYLARGLSRAEADTAALDVLALLNLSKVAHRRFQALSGGEAQRLMMARAVATDPHLLLMDEPTAQLDSRNAADVLAVLEHLSGIGPAVVIATHDPRVRAACTTEISLSSVS